MNHYKKILAIISIIMIFVNSLVCVSVYAACGNKIIEAGEGEAGEGEACEPPNVGACNENCKIEPFLCMDSLCGNGMLDPGEQCEGEGCPKCVNPCDGNCPLCGNGMLDPGEQCEGADCPNCKIECNCDNWQI